ncbi:uncharacterized protein C12orf56 homolog [Ctenodactylus gundi]
MASPARSGFPARANSRLDAFLRRRLAPEVYDAVRAYEPCVVVSRSEKRACKYVVLSDQLLYLTENPPRSLRRVVALRDVLAIDLIDDYPEFLNSPDREINQHIRIIYSSALLKKEREKSKGAKKFLFPFQHADANSKKDLKKLFLQNPDAFRRLPTLPGKSSQSTPDAGPAVSLPSGTTHTKELQGFPGYRHSPSEISFTYDGNRNESHLENLNLEKKESELHLYVISTTSSLFLHLKSSWNNYIIKATLLQDPQYARELNPVPGSQKPYRSEEKMKHFSQLKSELFLKDNSLRKILCLITELKVAAQKNFILKRLFWKTSDLFCFLVNKLHEYLPESRDKNALQNKGQRADELAACIEIIQTLGLMFRETEIESSRLSTLAAKKGALFNLLVILITKPQIPKSHPVFDTQLTADSALVDRSMDAELQKLILEYTDKATALLYEILLVFQQGNLGLGSTKFAISWIMSFLQSCPPIVSFVASIVKQVVKGLSVSFRLLSPCQAVLLYQQFYILKSCLQYSKTLAEYIRNDHREEFRYFIHMPALEKRLPLCYPITQPTTRLFQEVLQLVEQKQR